MSSAAITYPNGRTIVATGPPDMIGPYVLGAQLAHGLHVWPADVRTTGAPAPRSVVDACAWRYLLDEHGAVTTQRPARDGRWTTVTRTRHHPTAADLEELPR